jgi:hypothetical protein
LIDSFREQPKAARDACFEPIYDVEKLRMNVDISGKKKSAN